MIAVEGLTKRYGDRTSVDDLSFTVEPGQVTGFLGPNGAGKSTTLRMIVGLASPTAGRATIDGRRYDELDQPLQTVGALLEVKSWHPARSVRHHLLWMAQTQGLPRRRVEAVIDLVGLHDVAGQRAGGFSLGMGQRLNIAAALLGDPKVLILDEPVNGLDPSGVRWIRDLMKQFAARGGTVLVSSHLMNEMAVTADHLIIIAKGRMVSNCSTQEFINRNTIRSLLVRSHDLSRLTEVLQTAGAAVRHRGDALSVTGLEAEQVAGLASQSQIVIHELSPQTGSLEEAFMSLTGAELEYAGSLPGGDQ